jgi:PAS domain S-box-containing protein
MNREFAQLLESLANGVLITDSRGKVVFTNTFLDRMFGYESGELLGKSVDVLLPEELVGAHGRHRKKYQAAPETRLMGAGRDLLARRKDGSVFPVEIGLSPLRMSEELQVAAIVTDITARKHAEQRSILQRDVALALADANSLAEVAPRLLSIIAHALGWDVAMLWLEDAESGWLRLAASWAKDDSLSVFIESFKDSSVRRGDSLPGEVWLRGEPQWFPAYALEAGSRRAELAARTGLCSAFALPMLFAGRTMGVMEFHGRRFRQQEEGSVEIASAVASQIGQFVERKRSQQALGEVEARYRTLFENAVFGVFRSTVTGEMLDANPAIAAILDYAEASDVLKLHLGRDVFKSPQDLDQLLTDTSITPYFNDREVEWKTRGGATIEVQLSGRIVQDEEGRPVGIEAIVDNVSQRRLLERQFLQAQKMEAIGRLAGGVAHDFNNLLTIIAVSTDTLLDQTTGQARETIGEIAHATEQGASLVRQLMAFSRNQDQVQQAVNLNQILTGSHRMIAVLAGEDIRIELQLRAEDCRVAVETNRFEQVLMNLVANARDAMPSGGTIAIATSIKKVDDELARLYSISSGTFVSLRLADTGHGIPPEIQPHIFEPFFSTKEEGKGTGLGLSTVYGIVRQYGGHILCESVVNEGTTFTILLPAAAEAASSQKTYGASRQLSKTPQSTGRILLVEDQAVLRTSIKRILERAGYDIVVAEDGPDAIRRSEDPSAEFDLLITDIVLPQMRGTELAARLKERYPRMRVLFMSGYSEEKIPLKGAGFLPKPFRREVLLEKVRLVLYQKA